MGDYRQFLARATTALLRDGGRVLLGEDGSVFGYPEWTEGWTRIILADQPGTGIIYAFTDASALSGERLRRQIDALAQGVAGTGLMRQPGLRVIAVAVYPSGLGSIRPRQVTSLAPSTYYAGLRPSTWAVDLTAQRVHTGGLVRSEGARLLQNVARGVIEGEVLDDMGVRLLEREQGERMDNFYQLMRGNQPIATYLLIGINVAVFLLLYTGGGPSDAGTLRSFGALSAQLVMDGQWWRLLTSIFLHASIPHILFNMTSLFAVGTLAERLYGTTRFLAIYFGAGLIGSLASVAWAIATNTVDVLGVGASGAIFGVAGALLTVRFQPSDVIPRRLRNRVSSSMLPLVLLSLGIAFVTPYVDNGAHIGGLLGGMALSLLFPVARHARSGAGAGRA